MWLQQAIEQQAHISWHQLLEQAIKSLPKDYMEYLTSHQWLPGKENIFNAFRLPLNDTHYILYGESPYPRAISANGFAFWDASVGSIWSENGLSKTVNRATSLRNFIKMLLIAEGHISSDSLSSPLIATLDKTNFVQTLSELFNNFLSNGFLLLNASLALSDLPKNNEAKYWLPFHEKLLDALAIKAPHIKLILFGKIAEKILALPSSKTFNKIIANHPFNISFIYNQEVQSFFQSFHMLKRK